ncbi:40S ribosomal protein mrp2, mitochondrial [Microbotryomycetes sp. JL221]|nr:40S ribosomal protein mrp2, mitochondrial [Microbotryomycetes sp. JL221]
MPRPLPGHMALKDFKARKTVAANELLRRAYLYIVRNETVDPKVRSAAMLKLNAFPKDARPTTIKNRCTETGRGGGVLSEYGLCRHRFKLAASAGDIPGVSKASW